MNRKVITAIVLVVLVVALGVPAYLLYDAWCAFGNAEQSQKSAMERLKSLHGKKPFPAESNILVETANIAAVEGWRKDLLKRLSEGAVPKTRKTPATFKISLNEVRNKLLQASSRSGVIVPEKFAFGFGTYDGELLPDSKDDLPTRLSEQLTVVEYICKILIDEKIYELNAVQRDDLEGSRAGAASGPVSRRPGRPAQPPVSVAGAASAYRKLHFVVEFRAKERAVVGILNRFAKDPMFMVVTGLDLERVGADTVGVSPIAEAAKDPEAAAPAAAPAVVPPRENRLVSGPKFDAPVRVRLDVDVYRFNEE